MTAIKPDTRLKACIKSTLRSRFSPLLPFYMKSRSKRALKLIRGTYRIQLSVNELTRIHSVLAAKENMSFLVFGLGNDSLFWKKINPGGRTFFLEDNEAWLKSITDSWPQLESEFVTYGTVASDWECLLERPDLLKEGIPKSISKQKWDVILVDAPNGWDGSCPGRMKSIYWASQLVAPGGNVFVHDCDREIERAYCDRILKNAKFAGQVDLLRHYSFE